MVQVRMLSAVRACWSLWAAVKSCHLTSPARHRRRPHPVRHALCSKEHTCQRMQLRRSGADSAPRAAPSLSSSRRASRAAARPAAWTWPPPPASPRCIPPPPSRPPLRPALALRVGGPALRTRAMRAHRMARPLGGGGAPLALLALAPKSSSSSSSSSSPLSSGQTHTWPETFTPSRPGTRACTRTLRPTSQPAEADSMRTKRHTCQAPRSSAPARRLAGRLAAGLVPAAAPPASFFGAGRCCLAGDLPGDLAKRSVGSARWGMCP
jgi:hypothetical protein